MPAEKISIASGRAGAVSGILLVAALLPLPLDAAIDHRELARIAAAPPSGNSFPYVARGSDDQLPGDQFVVDWSTEVSDAVVPPVKRQVPKTPDAPPETPPDAAPPADATTPAPAVDSGPWPARELDIVDRVQDWLARANREFQTTVIRRLSTTPAGVAAEDEIARKLEEVKAQDAESQKRAAAAEDARKAAEAKAADERRAAVEAQRREDERRAAETAKVSAPPPLAETKPEDSARLAEEMKQERARIEAEADRIETQRKAAEAQRKADEAKHLEEERARLAAAKLDDDRRQAEKKAAAEAEIAAAAEAEKKAAAEAKRAAAAAEAEKNAARAVELKPAAAPLPSLSPPAPRAAAATVPPVASAAEPGGDRQLNMDEPPARQAGSVRQASSSAVRGPVVKRWVWRARNGRCHAAGRRISLPGRYTVARGDSLWLISQRFYRTGRLYRKLYRANRSILRDPDLIYPCQRLYVPRRH